MSVNLDKFKRLSFHQYELLQGKYAALGHILQRQLFATGEVVKALFT